jgi:GDP-L-fucose synthase
MKEKVLVTGGSGLVGCALQELAKEMEGDYEFLFLSSKDVDLCETAETYAIIFKFSPNIVIHLAARVGGLYDNLQNNAEFFNDNVLINLNVLNACSDCPSVKKVISCMSTCIFPDGCSLPLTVDQLHQGLPHSSNLGYSFAKRMIDVQNRLLWKKEKQFIGIIPTNIYGPHDKFSLEKAHVLPALIHRCYLAKTTGSPYMLKGSGMAERQFIYSKDVAKMIILIMKEYDSREPVILAGKEEVTIREVAELIKEKMDFDGEVVIEQREEKGQLRKTADSEQFLSLFPDFTFTSLERGVEETVDWFVHNIESQNGKLRL